MRQFDDDVIDVNTSPISGINDSSYNSFPQSPSYMGGFAPTVEEPRYAPMPIYEEPISVIAPEPVYEEPIKRTLPIEPQPVYQEPVYQEPVYQEPVVSGKCMRVIFSANRGFSAQAYWTDCSGQKKSKFVSVNETLEVDALDGTASGLPFMSYPIGSSPYEPQPQPYIPPYETSPAPIETSVEPIDEIFLMPVSIGEEPIVMPSNREVAPPIATEPTPVDAIKTGVMPADYIETKATPVQTDITPETPSTLPTKGVSKDLKPYIIAGVVVVGLLIASRLLSKK
jgi:hypothetical protein